MRDAPVDGCVPASAVSFVGTVVRIRGAPVRAQSRSHKTRRGMEGAVEYSGGADAQQDKEGHVEGAVERGLRNIPRRRHRSGGDALPAMAQSTVKRRPQVHV
eukprot:scaffold7128_cov114-Isochrysis_galbana.AAC.5